MRVTAGVKASSISPANARDSHPDQCDLTARAIANAMALLGRKRTDSTWGAPSGCAMKSTTSRSPGRTHDDFRSERLATAIVRLRALLSLTVNGLSLREPTM